MTTKEYKRHSALLVENLMLWHFHEYAKKLTADLLHGYSDLLRTRPYGQRKTKTS